MGDGNYYGCRFHRDVCDDVNAMASGSKEIAHKPYKAFERHSRHREAVTCRDLERRSLPDPINDSNSLEAEISRKTSAVNSSQLVGFTRYPCAPDARARALSVSYAAPE